MSRPVRLRSPAEYDVIAHTDFLAEKSVDVALRFVDAFEAAIAQIGRSPEIGGQRRFKNPRLVECRVWPIGRFRNFLIYYRVLPNEIEVIRVLHGSQDVNAILGANAE